MRDLNLNNKKNIPTVRGMNPQPIEAIPKWQYLEKILIETAEQLMFQQIRPPFLEFLQLFKRTAGESTDVVQKELYVFPDRNGDDLCLRPEGTAGCARLAHELGYLRKSSQKFWYLGPFFRHERPQKGRYRQFHQFGIEVYGYNEPYIDIECLILMQKISKRLGISNKITLEINYLADSNTRSLYSKELIKFLTPHKSKMHSNDILRLEKNPLRILDSKEPSTQDLLQNAPKLDQFFSSEQRATYDQIQTMLKSLNITFKHNAHLVRGLDYYSGLVFEWKPVAAAGSQDTICAGGRYDSLFTQLGQQPLPATGFAIGIERLINILDIETPPSTPDIYWISFDGNSLIKTIEIMNNLLDTFPQLKMEVNYQLGSLKNQFKHANKSQAHWAIIIGEEELTNQSVQLKNLKTTEQCSLKSGSELVAFLRQHGYAEIKE
jgi:histidyl-tRNA synthetase